MLLDVKDFWIVFFFRLSYFRMRSNGTIDVNNNLIVLKRKEVKTSLYWTIYTIRY